MKLIDLNKPLPITEMCQMASKYGTDKHSFGYTSVYYEIMKEFRNETVNIFEIGIFKGASIRMWHNFFLSGKIYGIDNGRLLPAAKIKYGSCENPSDDDAKLLQPDAILENIRYEWLENDRIKCFTADQRSENQLHNAFNYFNCNEFDVILDDGHHFQEHQQKSLGIMFPNIKSGKYYIIEDVIDHAQLLDGKMYWGQKEKDASDTTDFVFTSFIKTGKLESPYLSKEQSEYIVNNIDDIFLYENLSRNNSPVSGNSKLLIIKKG